MKGVKKKMEYAIIGVLMIIGYIIIWSLIDRICKCIEHCANARAFGKLSAGGVNVNKGDLDKKIKEGK